MILKKRLKPPEIFQLESLLQRSPSTHPQAPHWTEKLRRITAGYNGEQRVDSLWHEIPIPYPHFFIHDLYLQKLNSSHQIDTLLVTNRFILVLEIKNISGLLYFNPHLRQFFRTNKDGSIDGMSNPDDQVRRHEKWLEHFLFQQNIKLPVIGAIVFTYPSSVIQSTAGDRIIIQASGLPFMMEQLHAKYPKDALTEKKTKQLANQLAELHSIKPLKRLSSSSDLIKGVLCPNCPGHKLAYGRKKWRCEKCLHVDPDAHFLALEQYRVLIKTSISNREFRHFTGITSVSIASKLLTQSAMAYQGSFKNRVYLIPERFKILDSK